MTPEDLERLFADADAEGESQALEQMSPKPGSETIRCRCGAIVNISLPTRCSGCGAIKAYWKMIDGRILALKDMTLGHLSNTIRMLAAKAEAYQGPLMREKIEIALDLLYEELGSRESEIKQASGIMAALSKSLTSGKTLD